MFGKTYFIKTCLRVCLSNTFLGHKLFYKKKSGKPNKVLNIWPNFDPNSKTNQKQRPKAKTE